MTKEEIKKIVKEAVKEGMAENHCFLSTNEKAVIKDVAEAGTLVKKIILGGMAGAILYLIIQGVVLVKGWFN